MKYKKIISFLQQNNIEEAKKEIFKELSNNSADTNIYNFLGTAEAMCGEIENAIKNFRISIKLDPNNYNANHNLAVNLSKIDLNNIEIDFFFKKSIESSDLIKNPNYINFLINYGLFLNKIKSNNGEKYFNLAINKDPKNHRAYIGLSQYYFENNKFDDCIKICNEALNEKKIFHEGLYYDLGNSYLQKKFFNESKEAFQKALNFNKFNIDTHNNLGLIYYYSKNYEQSLFHFNIAIGLNPKSWKVLSNLGAAYFGKGDLVNAIKNFRKSHFFKNDNPVNLIRIAGYYLKLNKKKLAIHFYQKSINLEKNDRDILSNYLYSIIFDENVSYDFYLSEAKKINFIKKSSPKIPNEGYKKNKVGFVSADFRDHSVGHFVKDTLKYLSKSFDVYCYSNSVYEDTISEDIKKSVYSWNKIYSLSTEDVSSQIINSKIDILFDLSGHTLENRLDIFAARSSPIQISWCGWLASTGLDDMDYTIIDKYIFTKNLNKFFKEKLIVMESVWNTYSPHKIFFEKEINLIPPCIKNGYLTFAAFHNLLKINDSVIKAWAEIIKNTNNKIYFMSNEFLNEIFLKKFIKRFTAKGVSPDQLIFSKSMSRENYFNEFKKIDIFLDTFPYCGVTSSFESIGLNVPILTLEGEYFLSRCGYSINSNLNMDKLIAKTIDEYVTIGKNLSFETIIQYKKLLSSIDKKKCTLFDSEKFTSELSLKLKQLM